ncbi:Curli production assembly/transport component CsgG [compost metagenome]
MKLIQIGLVALVVMALSSCGNKNESKANSDATPSTNNVSAPMPDTGKIETVSTKAQGFGPSPAAATADAMKLAILQVNGATIDSGSVQVKYGLDVTDGKDFVSLRASGFAETVAQKSGGAITNFKILDVSEPFTKNGQYKVSIEADIARFTAPKDSRMKVVVAPIRLSAASFNIGGESFPAQKIAEGIQQKVSIALTNTGRFSVLERQDTAEIEQELALIKSGQAPRAEAGKLGQANTADVIWTGTINTLAYNRHSRQLRSSDRELVSYSGGWGVTQKMVNVATRQVLTSDSLQGKAPDMAPTTMGSGINANLVLQDMENEIVNSIVTSILTHTFPITVVSRDESIVVLSQGGQAVKPGNRYALVLMGKELKDPQTGESLGRIESPCCEVVIDKVTPNLSYGHLEKVAVALDKIPDGGLQLREQLRNKPVTAAQQGDADSDKPSKQGARKASRSEDKTAIDIQGSKEDGKW